MVMTSEAQHAALTQFISDTLDHLINIRSPYEDHWEPEEPNDMILNRKTIHEQEQRTIIKQKEHEITIVLQNLGRQRVTMVAFHQQMHAMDTKPYAQALQQQQEMMQSWEQTKLQCMHKLQELMRELYTR